MESSRLGLSDLQHGHPGIPARQFGPAAAAATPVDAHTILHARTPEAARQIRQLTTSLRDCNRAVSNVDALSKELQDLTNNQEDEIKQLRSQLSRSESRRKKAQSQGHQSVRFQQPPASDSGHETAGRSYMTSTSGRSSSSANSDRETLSGMLGQSLRQQDELRRELQHQSQTLRHMNQEPRPSRSQATPTYTIPTQAMPTLGRADDGRQQDQLHHLSQSMARIDDRLTSQRHREEAVSSARLHNQMETLRGDVQRLEQGQGKGAASTTADHHMSTLQQQMHSLEAKHQQTLSTLQQSIGDLQQRPSKQDALLQEVIRLRDEVKAGQERSSQSQHRQTVDSTDRLAGRLDSLDVSLRERDAERSAVLQRLDKLQHHLTSQEENRSTTLGRVLKLQEQFADMERDRDRLTLQVEFMKTELRKQDSHSDDRGTTAALRESERLNADLVSRLQRFDESAGTLRQGNEQLQGELRQVAAASQRQAEQSLKEKDRALQLSHRYKTRYQAEAEQRIVLQKKLENSSERLHTLESQHQNDQSLLSHQAEDIKTLRAQLRSDADQYEAGRMQLQSELTTAHSRYSTTEEDRMELQKELDSLRVESQETLRHYQSQHGQSSSLTEKLTSKLSKLREREKELQLLVKSCTHREGLMREEMSRMKKTSSEFQLQHRKQVETLMSQLKQQSESAEQRIATMSQRQQQQLQEMTTIIDTQKADLSGEKACVKELGAQKQLVSGERLRFERRCLELEKEVEACKRKIAQQRETYKEKISQLKGMCVTSDGHSIEDVVTQLAASRHLSEQILQDQETILRAVAGEVDSLITQVTQHSSLPKPILPDTSGLETDARKWISAILGKLTWLQRELRLKEERERLRKVSDSSRHD